MLLRVLPWAFGLAPALQILLTWSDHHRFWWVKTYALPIVAVEFVTVAVALAVALRTDMRLRLTTTTACLAALLAIVWGTVPFAPRPGIALLMSELWTLHLLFGLAAARLFHADDLTQGLLAGFVISAALLALFAVTAPAGLDWVGELPGLGNPRMFALYAAAAIGLCLALIAGGKWWACAVAIVAFTLIFWSGSRGGVVASLVGLVLCVLLFPKLRKPIVWGTFIGSAFAGAVIARVIGSPPALFGLTRMTDTGDNGRIDAWREAVILIRDRPWFGYGEGQMDSLSQIPWLMHPHNVVLQVLLAWGMFGFALIVVMAVGAARRIRPRVDDQTLPLVCAAMVLVVYSMIDGALYNVHTIAVFAACVGIAAVAPRRQASN